MDKETDREMGAGDAKTRVLLVHGGGHQCPLTVYEKMLDAMPGIEWTAALLPESAGKTMSKRASS